MLCPRLGDAFALTSKVNQILQDNAQQSLRKAASKQLSSLSLASHKLCFLSIGTDLVAGLQSLTTLNLSRNNLFDSATLFTVWPLLFSLQPIIIQKFYFIPFLGVISTTRSYLTRSL